MATKMVDRIKKFQQRAAEQGTGGNFDDNEKIFFEITEGTHTIRIVGDFVSVHSHWIAHSKYSKVRLFEDSAFTGNDRLRKNVNCPDFDIETEMKTKKKTCNICKLKAAANDILVEGGASLDPEQKKLLEGVTYDCAFAERNFFLCIDRDNPEIAPGKPGFKIIELPKAAMKQWCTLVESNVKVDPSSIDEGVDITLKRSKDKNGKAEYSLSYVMDGLSLKQTPLTDEEKAYKMPDIKKIMGKMPDQEVIYNKLLEEFRELIDDAAEETEEDTPEEKPAEVEKPKTEEKPKPKPAPVAKVEEIPEAEDEQVSDAFDTDNDEDPEDDVPF